MERRTGEGSFGGGGSRDPVSLEEEGDRESVEWRVELDATEGGSDGRLRCGLGGGEYELAVEF